MGKQQFYDKGKVDYKGGRDSAARSCIYRIISAYLLEQGATLRDGETIGLTAEQKLTITLSEGVNVEGKSLKIGF